MTKGKYAAKAANRTANLDNELLQEKIREIAELKGQLAARDALIERERVDRSGSIIARADELSAKMMEQAHAEVSDAKDKAAATLRDAAVSIGELFEARGYASIDYVTIVLPKLIPDAAARSAHIAKYHPTKDEPNRRDRRQVANALARGLAATTNAPRATNDYAGGKPMPKP